MAARKQASAIDMSGLLVKNLGTPSAPGDAASKAYVDSKSAAGAVNLGAGQVFLSLGSAAPAGTLICDGSVVSRTTYAGLFSAIGTTHNTGGEASTEFRLPNFKGRTLVGRDAAQSEFATIGQTGGAKTHTLSANEIPSHNHTFQGGSHTWAWGTGGLPAPVHLQNAIAAGGNPPSNNAVTSQGYWTQTNYTGGGAAHNNLQPYGVGNWVITTGGSVGSAAEASSMRRGMWSGSAGSGNTDRVVNFAAPYPSGVTPHVVASFTDANLDWLTGIMCWNVTNAGFTLRIRNTFNAAISCSISYIAMTA